MHIVSGELIAGHPAIEVRHFLRRYRSIDFYIEAAEDALVLSPRTSTIFMNRLKGLGFVDELGRSKWDGRRAFRLTIKGQALANASAARLLHRKTAERLLAQFLERVQRVNSIQEFAYRVEHVVLFGSILSDIDRLGDVDIAVQLQPKVDKDDAFQEWSMARRRAAEAKGRNFRGVFDWAMWPTQEIFLQLKARSAFLRHAIMDDFEDLDASAKEDGIAGENAVPSCLLPITLNKPSRNLVKIRKTFLITLLLANQSVVNVQWT